MRPVRLTVLKEALEQEDLQSLRHTLIYASDKAPGQLEEREPRASESLVYAFTSLTYEETCNRKTDSANTPVIPGWRATSIDSKEGT